MTQRFLQWGQAAHSVVNLALALLVLGALVACENRSPAAQRAAHLAQSKDEVVIGVVWPLTKSKASLINGIELAQAEINQEKGVLAGRKIKIVMKDDESSLSKGRLMAQEMANNPEVCAVIGHLNTYIAAPASLIYEKAGILMLTPGASGQKLTESGHQFIFRSLPGNRDQGRQIADYAREQGYKNIAVYYIKNDYGIDLANNFEQRINGSGAVIADRRSYNMGGDNYAGVMADWASFLKFDAIFLAGSLPESAQIIREARAAGITAPIFGGLGLDSTQLIQLGGKDVEGTVVFSLFNVDDTRPQTAEFRSRYQRRFGKLPDSAAAQGYDALQLIAQAIRRANSGVPEQIAAALRSTRQWPGVSGNYHFNEQGDLVDKPLFSMVVRNGKFVPLAPASRSLPPN